MLWFLLVLLVAPLVGLSAVADSIAVEVSPDRHMRVQEHYSVSGPIDFEFLACACARVENIQSGGRRLETYGSGPWITVPIPVMTAVDLTYEVVPVLPSPRTCDVPILMPKRAVESVSVIVRDMGSGLSSVLVPQLTGHADLRMWTATFPAVPSHIQLEWGTGNTPPASSAGATGRFAWNFWGLAGVLVAWTVSYLLWARRQGS